MPQFVGMNHAAFPLLAQVIQAAMAQEVQVRASPAGMVIHCHMCHLILR